MGEHNTAPELLLPAIPRISTFSSDGYQEKGGWERGVYFSSKEELLDFCISSSM